MTNLSKPPVAAEPATQPPVAAQTITQSPVATETATQVKRRIPWIWAFPLVAILIGAWLAWDTISDEGPTIMVSFNSAEGLQPGKSQLMFKEMDLGTVKSLEFTPDRNHVIATIATRHQAEPLLTDAAVFWVVKPRLFAGSVSGLETLLSGSYV